MKRLHYLDGLRGIMAINVLISHFVIIYYPQMYFKDFADNGGPLAVFANSPLSILVNGNIAVHYFFVLTGFLAGRTFLTKSYPPPRNT